MLADDPRSGRFNCRPVRSGGCGGGCSAESGFEIRPEHSRFSGAIGFIFPVALLQPLELMLLVFISGQFLQLLCCYERVGHCRYPSHGTPSGSAVSESATAKINASKSRQFRICSISVITNRCTQSSRRCIDPC